MIEDSLLEELDVESESDDIVRKFEFKIKQAGKCFFFWFARAAPLKSGRDRTI